MRQRGPIGERHRASCRNRHPRAFLLIFEMKAEVGQEGVASVEEWSRATVTANFKMAEMPTINIPLPPRTPTPPPEEQRPSAVDPPVNFNPNNLSVYQPEDEMEPTSTSSRLPPTTPEKKQDGSPFNFQPAAMAKSPIAKSVSTTVYNKHRVRG
jgi:hypothetical protein